MPPASFNRQITNPKIPSPIPSSFCRFNPNVTQMRIEFFHQKMNFVSHPRIYYCVAFMVRLLKTVYDLFTTNKLLAFIPISSVPFIFSSGVQFSFPNNFRWCRICSIWPKKFYFRRHWTLQTNGTFLPFI